MSVVTVTDDVVTITLTRVGAQDLMDSLTGDSDREQQMKNETAGYQVYSELFDLGFYPSSLRENPLHMAILEAADKVRNA